MKPWSMDLRRSSDPPRPILGVLVAMPEHICCIQCWVNIYELFRGAGWIGKAEKQLPAVLCYTSTLFSLPMNSTRAENTSEFWEPSTHFLFLIMLPLNSVLLFYLQIHLDYFFSSYCSLKIHFNTMKMFHILQGDDSCERANKISA